MMSVKRKETLSYILNTDAANDAATIEDSPNYCITSGEKYHGFCFQILGLTTFLFITSGSHWERAVTNIALGSVEMCHA